MKFPCSWRWLRALWLPEEFPGHFLLFIFSLGGRAICMSPVKDMSAGRTRVMLTLSCAATAAPVLHTQHFRHANQGRVAFMQMLQL